MKATIQQFFESNAATLCGTLAAAVVFIAANTSANTESGIATTPTNGLPSACLESDLRKLLEDCIARNMTNPPPGNPGPFTRGYKEMVVIMAQCFSGGFHSLTNIGDNIVVATSVGPQQLASAGTRKDQIGETTVMLWFDVFRLVHQQNSNAPVAAIADFIRTNFFGGVIPPAGVSAGGAGIVMGDPMDNLQPGTSFHAVLFGGFSDIANKTNVTQRDWDLRIGSVNALKDMNRLLQETLHIDKTNIQSRTAGTYADLGAMITNAWTKMNDNEQFILFIADHGTRHCGNTNVVPRPSGNGFCANFTTEPYLKDPAVRQPFVGLKTSFVGAPGEVWLNSHCIGTLPVNGPAYREFFFNPNLIAPVGQDNLVQVVVPNSNVGVDMVDLCTGPVLGSEFPAGYDPNGAVVNVRNATGMSKTGFQAVYEGELSTNVTTRARRTMADATPIADWAVGNLTISYNPGLRVTTLEWQDVGNPIPDGGYASFSVVDSNRAMRSLKYAWLPPSSNSTNDLAPVNLKSINSVTSSNLEFRVAAAPLLSSTQQVVWSVRFAGNRIPASQFYFDDPAITSLPNSSTQTVTLDPEVIQTVTVSIPPMSPLDPLPTAVIESWENWVNGGTTPNDISRITQIPMLSAADTTCVTNCPGSGVFFTVNVAGGKFQWYKDGVPIPGETNGTLTLPNLTKDSAGIYTGIGTNTSEIKRKFFKLFVRDQVAPVVTGPADITVEATSASGALVNYSGIGASDSCGVLDGSTFQANPPPGLFPIGTTEVTASVADTAGNVGKHTFYVTVLPLGADLGISANRDYMLIRWADTNAVLQCAPKVTGPWDDMPGSSPYTFPLDQDDEQYFRLLLGF